jgi:hypothetical protein
MATYGALVAMALALGVAAPAQAAVSIIGDTVITANAYAKTNGKTFKKKERLYTRAIIKYKAEVFGIGLPLTAAHISSIPTTFGQPRIEETTNANLSPNKYVKRWDSWLGKSQWTASGDTSFIGTVKILVRGSAPARSRGSRLFHAGTGTGHLVDSNSTIRVVVK